MRLFEILRDTLEYPQMQLRVTISAYGEEGFDLGFTHRMPKLSSIFEFIMVPSNWLPRVRSSSMSRHFPWEWVCMQEALWKVTQPQTRLCNAPTIRVMAGEGHTEWKLMMYLFSPRSLSLEIMRTHAVNKDLCFPRMKKSYVIQVK